MGSMVLTRLDFDANTMVLCPGKPAGEYCDGTGDCGGSFCECAEAMPICDGTGGSGSGSTCADNCGGHAGTCYCDSICTYYNDCCSDYTDYCSGNDPVDGGSGSGSGSGPDTSALTQYPARPASLSMVLTR